MFPRDLTFRLKFIFILITIIIVFIANILLLMLPQTKGFLIDDLNANTVMAFDQIDYQLESGHRFDFKQGGFIVPIENNNNPLGIVIYASGEINYKDNPYNTSETYVFLREEQYYEIMGELLLYKSEEEFFIDNANTAFSSILGQTPFIETPIGKKYYPLSEDSGYIVANIDGEFKSVIDREENNLFSKPTFFLISFIHILFSIAILFIVVVLTDRKPKDEPNRSLDSTSINAKPLWISLLVNSSWLLMLYLGANKITVQILLMISMIYILYLLYVNNKVRLFDLKLINHTKNTMLALPITIALIGFLFFGNTSITLQNINMQLTFKNIFLYATNILWIFFMSFSFIPLIHSQINKSRFQIVSIILYNIIIYIVFCIIGNGQLNVFDYFNAAIFIPLYTKIISIYAKRVYSFIPPVLTVILIKLLISVIR